MATARTLRLPLRCISGAMSNRLPWQGRDRILDAIHLSRFWSLAKVVMVHHPLLARVPVIREWHTCMDTPVAKPHGQWAEPWPLVLLPAMFGVAALITPWRYQGPISAPRVRVDRRISLKIDKSNGNVSRLWRLWPIILKTEAMLRWKVLIDDDLYA